MTVSIQAQIVIGKDTVSSSSVSLEFGDTENRGFILPYVENKSGITVEGTIIYDTSDYKVKYLRNGGIWVNMSEDDGTPGTIGEVDLSIQTSKTEELTAKVGIGTPTSIDGILVLEDTNKAMVLPKVNKPHLNIINPAAGMIVYDIDSKMLAVYNGIAWTFWEP